MGRLKTKSDYESIRKSRILQNQARSASLGLKKTISELRSMKTHVRKYQKVDYGSTPRRRSARLNQARSASLGLKKTISELRSMKTHVRKYQKVDYGSTPRRRSARLNRITADSFPTSDQHIPLRRSDRLRWTSGEAISPPRKGKLGLFGKSEEIHCSEGGEKRPANAPLVRQGLDTKPELSPDVLARHCASESRSNVYPSVFRHFCRAKTLHGEEDCKQCVNLDMDQPCIGMKDCSNNGVFCQACLEVRNAQKCSDHHETKRNYESIRNARILENQARLASLGLYKTISDLRSMASPVKTRVRKYQKVDYGCTPRRYSVRLKGITADPIATSDQHIPLRRSNRLRGTSGEPISPHKGKVKLFGKSEENLHSEGKEKRPANRPLLRLAVGTNMKLELSPDVLARRCSSESRGTVYHPIFGICCHFCRQKTLCAEEDCKRCGNLDMDQPCIGKTDCAVCHSSNGVLCRACLKVRYGEEMEEVRRNKKWMCPHCIEDKGINPYWICNSSLCLRKRKMPPTGLAIFKAREMGYKSVAHLLMDELQRTKCI